VSDLDGTRAARDDDLYESVRQVERSFEATRCERP
jgi:hypothetical protein